MKSLRLILPRYIKSRFFRERRDFWCVKLAGILTGLALIPTLFYTLGGIFGGLIATANFFFMAVGATLAADKAEKQDVKGGQATIQASYIGRLVMMALILFALVKSGLCDVFAVVLPLVFTRPILTLSEFFRKEDKA